MPGNFRSIFGLFSLLSALVMIVGANAAPKTKFVKAPSAPKAESGGGGDSGMSLETIEKLHNNADKGLTAQQKKAKMLYCTETAFILFSDTFVQNAEKAFAKAGKTPTKKEKALFIDRLVTGLVAACYYHVRADTLQSTLDKATKGEYTQEDFMPGDGVPTTFDSQRAPDYAEAVKQLSWSLKGGSSGMNYLGYFEVLGLVVLLIGAIIYLQSKFGGHDVKTAPRAELNPRGTRRGQNKNE
eukprot:GHVU01026111.1.p1 GENE.GHVU01026111.1~~GHVU01026111.1.p1  ORF type:complete len:241 (+),score=37.47 GHVU01026111.1:97-819(+)